MFEFLFKYPPDYFARGTLLLALPWWQLLLAALLILGLGFVALGYFHLRHRASRRDRALLTLLRGLALSLLIFSLSRPMLEVTTRVAQPNLVAILFDNSASMKLPDDSGAARSSYLRRQFDPEDGDLLADLRARFDTRMFAFGAGFGPVRGTDELDFGDGGSNLEHALPRLRETLRGEPLAGLVLVSDGATRWSDELERTLRDYRAAGIPVHSIGVGQRRYRKDIELSRVRLPRRILEGSRAVADLGIRQRGYDGRRVELLVEDDSLILARQTIELRPGSQTLKLPLSIDDSGARQLRFHIEVQPGELVEANNTRYAMPWVDDGRSRILYFEGEPRFEMKFVRRALADDENLRVVGLIRTADAKFYRVGVESAQELANGFPVTREELFGYDALILGSVDSSLLNQAQQQLIVDFVSKRGGALLLLGGRHAFAEGGWHDSPLRAILPVELADAAQPDFSRQVRIEPSAAAWMHPALLLAGDLDASIARWTTLPALTMVNPIREVRPGASLLLSGIAGDGEGPYVAMAWQRYGRGKVAAFAVQNSWLWQMHHEIELEDLTHELLWRQLLRWLVEEVPRRMTITQSAHSIPGGGSLELRGELFDAGFEAVADAAPRALLQYPDGREQSWPLLPDPAQRGRYQASISALQPGDYLLRVDAAAGQEAPGAYETRLRVSAEGEEFFGSEQNSALLRRIANTTGGRYFEAPDSGGLLAALDRQQQKSAVLTRLELWDMPLIFLLLVALLCGEWGYRRWRNLI